MSKVYINVTTRLILNIEEGIRVSDVVDQMEYDFSIDSEHGILEDSEIMDYEVLDSK